MSFSSTIKSLKYALFPESKLVDEGTKQINEVVRSIRYETDCMSKSSQILKKPDVLWKLTQDMRSAGQ